MTQWMECSSTQGVETGVAQCERQPGYEQLGVLEHRDLADVAEVMLRVL